MIVQSQFKEIFSLQIFEWQKFKPQLLIQYHAITFQRQRIETLFNPTADPYGTGWNITQSKIAIGSGGINGKGFQEGSQAHLDFLPETETDFIFAVIAEEFGFVGVCILLSVLF